MAAPTLTVKALTNSLAPFQGVDNSQNLIIVLFTVTVAAGANYTAGGDTLDFTQLNDLVKSQFPPLLVQILSQKVGGVSGYFYEFVPGTTAANGKMQTMWTQSTDDSPIEEIDGAYPAGVTGDTIVGMAIFPRL